MKRYKWVKIRKIKKEDEKLFIKMFYLKNMDIKVKKEFVYAPWIYSEIIREVIDAHYDDNLSREFYVDFKIKTELYKSGSRKKIDHHLFKMIGPIILIIFLLIFLKAIFAFIL